MIINDQSRIKDLLAFNQNDVIDALVKLNKNFSKLKNPLLRNLFARRVTIADACKIASCPITDFMSSMEKVGFEIDSEQKIENKTMEVFEKNDNDNENKVELDVRPILANDKDPLKVILKHINELEKGQGLKLINTFKPIPLIYLLAEKGFSHYTETVDADTIITYFKADGSVNKNISASIEVEAGVVNNGDMFDETLAKFEPENIEYIDVRGLEMPQPMLRIIEHIQNIVPGDALFVYHKKKPIFLLPELEKRGLKYLFKDALLGDVNMLIYKL